MHNDCSYIEHVHLLFCAHLLSLFLGLLDLDILSIQNAYGVSGLCNLKLQQFSFLHIQTLYVMIVRTLSMCTLYFMHIR